MIYHTLYISEASTSFSGKDDLESILQKSRINNKLNDVTGLLIFNNNFFIQLLEGRREQVVSRYNIILRDPRHTKMKNLIEYTDSNRIFPQWAMGLVSPNEHQLTIQELIPLLHKDVVKLETSRNKIISILGKFNQL